MSQKHEEINDQKILEDFLNQLIHLVPRGKRGILAGSVEQIIDKFGLNYDINLFTTDQRSISGITGRKSSDYFLRNQATGDYYIGSIKTIAEILGRSVGSLYIALRRTEEKGELYLYRNSKDGVPFRIHAINDNSEIESEIRYAEQLSLEYKDRCVRSESAQRINEDGSY